MKTAPIIPATITFDDEGVPFALAFGDRYHARAGAAAQAEHVFLRGNGLPARWQGRPRFVILETGFGLGNNFLATWAAWRRDAARCGRLHFVSIEKHPPRKEDLARVHGVQAASPAPAPDLDLPADLTPSLLAAWPPLTGDLHRLCFDDGRVELLLALGDVAHWLRRLQLQADALYLDGFAPERNPEMWSEGLFAALPRLCAAGATAATWSVARPVREGLAQHGFAVERAPGFAGKREMTVARFAPRHRAVPSARQQAALPLAHEAIVIGAGIAGAATAHALAEQGLQVTVLDAAAEVASGASGNPAALVRGLVSRDEGAHARWHRAAALEARRLMAPWVRTGQVPGSLNGVLHFGDDLADMHRRAAAAGWPGDYVQVLDAAAAAQLSGLPASASAPAWFFPGGGWLDPTALVRQLLARAGVTLKLRCHVAALKRQGSRWRACGPDGAVHAEADLVVLANAADAARLASVGPSVDHGWNLSRSRGQVSWWAAGGRGSGGTHGRPAPTDLSQLPRLPLARNGYVIPLPDGRLLCGATQTLVDESASAGTDARPQAADHAHNLAVLQRLTGSAQRGADAPEHDGRAGALLSDAAIGAACGRVAWRCHTADRLPLIGPLAAAAVVATADALAKQPLTAQAQPATRLAQPRHVPREPGLFVLSALGSRGITSAALGARVLAGLICGAPLPVDTDLLDATDAARHISRRARGRE